MRTAGDIARRALVRAGAVASGETPTAAELQDAVTTLGDMLDSWSLERLTVVGTKELTAPVSAQIRIGPSGDLIADRPNAITSAFVRSAHGDTELHQASPEFLDAVRLKDASGCGFWFSYEGAMPDGVLRLWPVPDAGTVVLRVTTPVVKLEDVNDELDLPPGWFHALVQNLAVQLCEEYGFAVAEALASTAQTSKAHIKRANLQPQMITADPALTGRPYGGFHHG